jgi:hypothetical protein
MICIVDLRGNIYRIPTVKTRLGVDLLRELAEVHGIMNVELYFNGEIIDNNAPIPPEIMNGQAYVSVVRQKQICQLGDDLERAMGHAQFRSLDRFGHLAFTVGSGKGRKVSEFPGRMEIFSTLREGRNREMEDFNWPYSDGLVFDSEDEDEIRPWNADLEDWEHDAGMISSSFPSEDNDGGSTPRTNPESNSGMGVGTARGDLATFFSSTGAVQSRQNSLRVGGPPPLASPPFSSDGRSNARFNFPFPFSGFLPSGLSLSGPSFDDIRFRPRNFGVRNDGSGIGPPRERLTSALNTLRSESPFDGSSVFNWRSSTDSNPGVSNRPSVFGSNPAAFSEISARDWARSGDRPDGTLFGTRRGSPQSISARLGSIRARLGGPDNGSGETRLIAALDHSPMPRPAPDEVSRPYPFSEYFPDLDFDSSDSGESDVSEYDSYYDF